MSKTLRAWALLPAVALMLAATPAVPENPETPNLLNAFGTTVVVEGDEIFVGRPGDFFIFPVPPGRAGGVHVFSRSGSGWSEVTEVASSDVEVGDGFGTSIAVDGDWLVVGAPKKDGGRGAAYLFRRDGDAWAEVARLSSRDQTDSDEFGASVAIDGALVVVGAPGRNGGAGAVVTYEVGNDGASEIGSTAGVSDDQSGRFGHSIAVSGSHLVVGAPGTMPSLIPGVPAAPKPGSVFLLAPAADGWQEVARSDADMGLPALFGWVVKADGGRVFASAPFGNQGTGFVRVMDTGDLSETGTITAAQPAPNAGFGLAFDVRGSTALVGMVLAQAALSFSEGDDGTWSQDGMTNDTSPNSFYGAGLAVGDDFAVVGMPGGDFFEGSTTILARNDAGEWASDETLITDVMTLDAIAGGEVECSEDGMAEGFSCAEVDIVSFMPLDDLQGSRGDFTNDVWGWTDPQDGTEYAIVGKNDATTFISLADPTNPVYLGQLPLTDGANENLWRDMKTYGNHVFIVADASGAHGVQIFDLTQLRGLGAGPDRIFEETAHYDGIFSAHNIVINEDSGFAYVVGASGGGETCGGGLHMIDVRDPVNPIFAGCFSDPTTGNAGTGYSHDAQCINYVGPDEDHQGKEICFGANETAMSIADVTDKANPQPISTGAYPNSAYVHQGWISEDHRWFFINDEGDELAGTVPRTRTLVWDVSDLDDPVLVKEHLGTTSASDHNMYIRDQFMYQSNYISGLRVLDISDPANPVEVGFFDTVPWGDDIPGFAGSWSNYPFFESGVIIVSSMREGVFFLKKRPRTVF